MKRKFPLCLEDPEGFVSCGRMKPPESGALVALDPGWWVLGDQTRALSCHASLMRLWRSWDNIWSFVWEGLQDHFELSHVLVRTYISNKHLTDFKTDRGEEPLTAILGVTCRESMHLIFNLNLSSVSFQPCPMTAGLWGNFPSWCCVMVSFSPLGARRYNGWWSKRSCSPGCCCGAECHHMW